MKAYIMGNYTEKAFQGFLKDPTSDRKAVVEQLTKAMGGTMHSMDIVEVLMISSSLLTFQVLMILQQLNWSLKHQEL